MKKAALALGIFYLALFILPLGLKPLVVPDEIRYGEIAREMVQSGDWVSPRFAGLRYFEKPVLGYWLNSASILAFGENAFAVRFASAVAAGLAALLVFLFALRGGAGRTEAWFAAAAFLTCQLVFLVGTFSVLDSMFSLFLTVGLYCFFTALHLQDWRRQGALALFGACCGLAFLTKGFLGLLFPVLVIVPYLFWTRRPLDLLRLPWTPIAAALAVALPWALMVHGRECDFWHYFFWVEHVKRFAADNAQHRQGFWYYIPILLGGALPWSFLAPAVWIGLRGKGLAAPATRFALCWLFVPFLFFTVSRGKLPPYILPCFPAVALLVASGLHAYFTSGRRKLFDVTCLILAAATALTAVLFTVNQLTGFPATFYGPDEAARWLFVALAVLAAAPCFYAAARLADSRYKLALFCLAPVCYMFITHVGIPERVRVDKAPERFFRAAADQVPPEAVVVSTIEPAGTACWYLKRSDIYILDEPGELDYGLNYPEAKHRLLSYIECNDLIKRSSGREVCFFTTSKEFRKCWAKLLPSPKKLVDDGHFTLAIF